MKHLTDIDFTEAHQHVRYNICIKTDVQVLINIVNLKFSFERATK